MGGLLIPIYFGGWVVVGVGKSSKIKRAGVGLMVGPLMIGLMILVWSLFEHFRPSTSVS